MESGDTLIEVLIALVVIGITSVGLISAFWTSISASSEHKDQATLESVLKAFVEQATIQLGRQTTTTLTTQIDSGATGVTTLNVNSIPNALGNGDALTLFSGGLTQNVTVNGAQASSSTPTMITVTSFTASSTFPVGSSVIFPKTPSFTACATPATYSAGGLTFAPLVTSQGTYTASITQVLFWDPEDNSFVAANDGDQDGDEPCNPAATPSPQQQLTATATNTKTGTSTSVDFVVSDPKFNPAPPAPPNFSPGAYSDTVVAGVPSSYAVSASGSPSPSLSASGQPSWAILVDRGGGNGALYFDAPASAIGHSFTFNLFAANSYQGGTTTPPQTFTVTVGQSPSITSANNETVLPGVPMPFSITTSGTPTASLSQTGMPAWATFTDNGNGTATLSGIPPLTPETDTFTIGAQNAASSVSQTFTLVDAPSPSSPVFASDTSDTVPINVPLSFSISAAGSPSPTITEAGALPGGVTFNGGTGSASLSGNPTDSGSFPITLTATNAAGATTQSFVLTVDPQSAPDVDSPSNASPACSQKGSTFQMTVVGSGFQSGANVASAGMTGTVIVIVVDSSHLTVVGTGSATAGTYSMTVTNPDGGTTTQSGAVSVVSGQC